MQQKAGRNRLAEEFLNLHRAPEILVLPNAWDAASAKVFEIEGCRAIGTTSAGIAAALGYPDGEVMTLAENADMVRRIAGCTALPVSADIERGYASSVDGVVAAARAVWDAGAVGLNLEDGTGDPGDPLFEPAAQREKIRAIRRAFAAEGISFVINARTDVFLARDAAAPRLREAIDRGNAYLEEGADCVFVPDVGDLDAEAIAALVKGIRGPVNIIAGATTPPIAELQRLGVARVSVGPRPMRAVLSRLREIARELIVHGTYARMTNASLGYSEINGWFARRKEPDVP